MFKRALLYRCPINGIRDDEDWQHLLSSTPRKALCLLCSHIKGEWFSSQSFPVLLSFHMAQSGLWMDLGEMDLEKSGCGYVKAGENEEPAVLSQGQSCKHWEGSSGPVVFPGEISPLPRFLWSVSECGSS